MKWADETRKLGVRTNADQPDQAAIAVAFGAKGIGLCRTEHMFFEGERIDAVREMIVADDLEGRKKALAKLLPMQKSDFAGLFKVMNGLPVTIRTLDPPLHEFLPHTENEIRDLAGKMGIAYEKLNAKIESLHETNPMLGHRGCRLGIAYPGDHRDAGAGHLRGGLRGKEGRHRRESRDHDPARRPCERVEAPEGGGRPGGERGYEGV